MSHDQDLFDPTEAGGEPTRGSRDPANVADGAVKHRSEGGTPRERDDGHPIFDVPTDTDGESAEHVDIYAEPAELYEDADEDEILDADEESTEETVEEAIADAIEEVEADIEEEEEILAEQRPQEMERKFEYLEDLLDTRHYADFREALSELNPVDAAEFFDELEPKRIPAVFKLLDKDTAAAVFAELEIEEQERIIAAMTDREISLMVEELALDDTTEMLKELPANMVHRIM